MALLSESLPSDESEQSSVPEISRGNRNRCAVPGIIYNTNTLEAYHALDKKSLLKEEAKKVSCYNKPVNRIRCVVLIAYDGNVEKLFHVLWII